jgi:hypothetical protein
VANRLGFLWKMKRLSQRQIRSSAALVCLAVQSRAFSTVVDTGRLAMRVWLLLNRAGFGVQPMTLSPLRRFIQSQRAPFDVSFSLKKKELPLWMFRTGISPRLPDASRTLRREVDEVLTIESSRP